MIGVLVEDRPRAYQVRAFIPLPYGNYSRHVVNDFLGDVPVTVSYCDRLDCVQVYTDAHAKTPLPVQVGGFTSRDGHRSMLLSIGSYHYRQDTGEALEADASPFPYTQLNYVRTTWGQWRMTHPNTDVYVLEPGFGGASPADPRFLSRRDREPAMDGQAAERALPQDHEVAGGTP